MFAAYLFAFHNWNWQNQKWNPQMPTFPCTIYETTHKTKYLNNKIPKLGTLKIKGWCVTLSPLPFYIKKYLKAKEEELWKLKYFTMQKNKHKK
jgi:hypothetical protein